MIQVALANHWIFHSAILFLNTDSLMNDTSNHIYEWAIESFTQPILSKHETMTVYMSE